MTKAKIAIACQGGGSQTAFTAGVLKTLFDTTSTIRIVDRRNAMSGNVSLLQDLNLLGAFERAFKFGALALDVLKEFGYPTETWIKLRLIQMSKPMLDSLDYASKLSRAPEHIHRLIEDGSRQAQQLMDNLSAPALTCEEMGRLLTGQTPGPAAMPPLHA
jgi:hypothetical protein